MFSYHGTYVQKSGYLLHMGYTNVITMYFSVIQCLVELIRMWHCGPGQSLLSLIGLFMLEMLRASLT